MNIKLQKNGNKSTAKYRPFQQLRHASILLSFLLITFDLPQLAAASRPMKCYDHHFRKKCEEKTSSPRSPSSSFSSSSSLRPNLIGNSLPLRLTPRENACGHRHAPAEQEISCRQAVRIINFQGALSQRGERDREYVFFHFFRLIPFYRKLQTGRAAIRSFISLSSSYLFIFFRN